MLGAGVGGHYDDGILKVDGFAVRIGQTSVVQYLEQNIQNFRMRFLNFIEQHD